MGCSSSTGVTAIEQDATKKTIASTGPKPAATHHSHQRTSSQRSSESSSTVNFHQQYVLLRKLGKGAFARVYACQEAGSASKEQLAVKITDLRSHKRGMEAIKEADPRLKRAAEKEASVLKRIGSQEYCCRLIDSIFSGCFHYMIMEKCSLTLLQALERLPELTERSLVKFIREMFLGVSSVHALRVIHRDIKPDNFLCSGPDSIVKLCDFGLAEVLSETSDGIVGVYGTAPFMSPEMLAGVKYGKPTDVWSLGVILYTLMIGQFPYIPAESNAKAMKAAIASGVPEPSFRPTSSTVQNSPQVLSLVKSLLHRDPARRLTAEEAIEHAWFTDPKKSSGKPQSLRAILSSAKRVGAFDVRNGTGNERMDSLDKELQELQEKYQVKRRASDLQNQEQQGRPHGVDTKAVADAKADAKAVVDQQQIIESATSTNTGQCTHRSGSDQADGTSSGSSQHKTSKTTLSQVA